MHDCTRLADFYKMDGTTQKITKILACLIILQTNLKLQFEVSLNSFRDYPLFEKPYVRQTIAQSGGWRLMAGHQCHFFTNFLTGTECFKRELKIKRVFLNRSLILNGGFEPEFDCVNVYLRNICTGILINDSKANELKLIFYGRFKQTFN